MKRNEMPPDVIPVEAVLLCRQCKTNVAMQAPAQEAAPLQAAILQTAILQGQAVMLQAIVHSKLLHCRRLHRISLNRAHQARWRRVQVFVVPFSTKMCNDQTAPFFPNAAVECSDR